MLFCVQKYLIEQKCFFLFCINLVICPETYLVQGRVDGLTFQNLISYALPSGSKPLINYTITALKIKASLNASEQIQGSGITVK